MDDTNEKPEMEKEDEEKKEVMKKSAEVACVEEKSDESDD